MVAMISTGCCVLDLFFILAGAFLALLAYFKHSYQYWEKKGVPYLKPTFPYGNNLFLLPKSITFAGEAKVWYDELKRKGHKFGGVYSLSRSVLVLVDPDYIKDVLAQDFQYFTDRDIYSNERDDPQTTHLFNIMNPGWKLLRQKLTPTFSSGKMKIMFNSIVTCSHNMIEHLEKCGKMADDVHIREVLSSFATDVIGTVAFGIDCNSFSDTHAEFRKQGTHFFDKTLLLLIRGLFTRGFPDLGRRMGLGLGRQESKEFFCKVVKDTIEYREKKNVRRPDFLQLLIDMNNESKDTEKPFNFNQIVANTMLFFIAGNHTSSTLMTYTLYELARNSDIQEKLRKEISTVLRNHKGEITYDALQEKIYLKQVMDETLRIYPPLTTLARVCTKDYQLRDTNISLEKGTPVVISTMGLGRDPEYFPDPMKFDPERFSHDKVANRHPYIHIPFGEGPRNCIGLRFGMMQSKIGVIQVLSHFKLKISHKTKMPLTYDPQLFLLMETETLYLNIENL